MSGNPYNSPSASPFMASAPRTISGWNYLLAFVVFFFASMILATIAGFIVGAAAGAILGAMGKGIEMIQLYAGVLGFLVSIPVQFVCFYLSVRAFIVRKLTPEAT